MAPEHAEFAAERRSSPAMPATRRWERLLVLIGICLPVPVLAGTGLSIPLPGPVERIAAALVSWMDAGPLDGDEAFAARNGSIVLVPGEAALTASAPDDTANPSRPLLVALAPADDATGPKGDSGGGSSKSGGGGGGGSGGGGSGGGGTGSSGGDDPEDDPDLVDDTVDEVGEATDPVVNVVEETAGDLLGTGNVLPGLGK